MKSPEKIKAKLSLASDDALFGAGYAATAQEGDDLFTVGAPKIPAEEFEKLQNEAPLQKMILAEAVYTFRDLNGNLHEIEEEAIIASYDILLERACAAIADSPNKVNQAVDLLRTFPYVAKLLGERAEAQLAYADKMKEPKA